MFWYFIILWVIWRTSVGLLRTYVTYMTYASDLFVFRERLVIAVIGWDVTPTFFVIHARLLGFEKLGIPQRVTNYERVGSSECFLLLSQLALRIPLLDFSHFSSLNSQIRRSSGGLMFRKEFRIVVLSLEECKQQLICTYMLLLKKKIGMLITLVFALSMWNWRTLGFLVPSKCCKKFLDVCLLILVAVSQNMGSKLQIYLEQGVTVSFLNNTFRFFYLSENISFVFKSTTTSSKFPVELCSLVVLEALSKIHFGWRVMVALSLGITCAGDGKW